MNQGEWERDLDRRQRNIVFPDTVQNEGRFYRNILRAGVPLSAPQRIGTILFAAGCLVSGAVMLALAIARGLSGGFDLITSLPLAAVAALPFALSWKLFMRALFDAPVHRSHEHRGRGHRRHHRS